MRILNEGMRLAGRYTLSRRLGAGGMSEVWLADDRQTQSTVALKFISGDAADSPERKALLDREWRIGSRLMHASIVRVFEFHDDPEGAFYALQYVGNTNIGALAGATPIEALRPIGLIADALRYAHSKGVVHRDIKATNVLLDSRGLPYLVDFGVATAPESEAIVGGGSDIAASPQQRAGDAPSPADDIYAVGVLIHEMLTGQPPGSAGSHPSAENFRSMVLADGSAMPAALGQLLDEMLAEDVGARPDAESVATRLAAAGYAAGPASTRFVGGAGALEEVVETVSAPSPYKTKVTPTAAPENLPAESPGIPPKLIFGGLGAALVLFLVVIFVLPELANREAPVAAESSPTVGDDLTTQPDATAAEGTVTTEDENAVVQGTSPSDASFSENVGGTGANTTARIKAATDDALGDLLSQLQRLRYRAIDRWGGQEYLDAVDVYSEGDEAYLARNYRLAGERYRTASDMLAPFFDRIDTVFAETLAAAIAAFEASDPSEAVRLFDLAASITPGNREAEAGLARAMNLQSVLSLMDQGITFEQDLELDAAKLAFQKALDLDQLWDPAREALARIDAAIKQLSFEQRMTEGFESLGMQDFESARAAFNAAKILVPTSSQPADGLLQLDQEIRLFNIRRLEADAVQYDTAEQWETSVTVYQEILEIDSDLNFAHEGLANARSRSALHARLGALIADPDDLSDPVTMQNATTLLLDLTRMEPIGPRLDDQKSELSRLLKRAATPLPVRLVSDNLTNVAIFKVGQFGTFSDYQLELRPGQYVAIGARAGFRDVRIEFYVAPEVNIQPIVVVCEEQI